MIKLKVIACDVMNREISYLSSQSSCFIDVTFLHQGLHNTPEKLRDKLQEEVDKANQGFSYNYCNTAPDYDYIILGYGLCSNGVTGIVSEKIPMLVPRAHDCITMLLGSKEKYTECFNSNPGTYWFSTGWIERGWQPSELKYNSLYKEYVQKYGEDNAEFLMDMEQSWMKDYKNAAFIPWDCLPVQEHYRKFTMESAAYLHWNYLEIPGNSLLLKKLLNAQFDDSEVLVVPPGKKIVQSYDENIIKVE
jgi:hypothetical protein